jgi:hypothetical protein
MTERDQTILRAELVACFGEQVCACNAVVSELRLMLTTLRGRFVDPQLSEDAGEIAMRLNDLELQLLNLIRGANGSDTRHESNQVGAEPTETLH